MKSSRPSTPRAPSLLPREPRPGISSNPSKTDQLSWCFISYEFEGGVEGGLDGGYLVPATADDDDVVLGDAGLLADGEGELRGALVHVPVRRDHELAAADHDGGGAVRPGLDAGVALLHAVADLAGDPVDDDPLGVLADDGPRAAKVDVDEPQRHLVEEVQAGLGDGYAGLPDGHEIPFAELLEDAPHAPLPHAG